MTAEPPVRSAGLTVSPSQRATAVWLGLATLTVCTTWGMSTDSINPELAVAGTFLLAAAKVALVIWEFMELRLGPWQVRAVFGTWVVAVTGIILVLWFASPEAALAVPPSSTK